MAERMMDQAESPADDAVMAVDTQLDENTIGPAESGVHDSGQETEPEPVTEAEPEYSWQASEYVHHHKGPTWYLGLAGIIVLLLIIAYVFKLWLSMGVFIAMGVAIAVNAHRPPRVLAYKLDSSGVTIEAKHYPYAAFRSFGVLSDTEWHTIDLEPTQRFMPRLTMLFDDEDFDIIVDHLTLHLPRVDRDPDFIEKLSRYLRF